MGRFLKTSLVIIVTIGAFFVGREFTREFLRDDNFEAELAAGLAAAAREINTQVPIKLDEMTTLVSADVSGTDLTYTNSLSIGAEELGADFGALQRDVLKDLVCENKDMMVTINHGGSFTYKYIDQDGRLVASIDITKRDCGG